MSAVASIVIQVDEKGAVTAINNVGSAIRSIDPAAAAAGRSVSSVGSGMETSFNRAIGSARLLREETGIFLPRALQSVIAQSQLLGPIMNSAFSAFAVVGFIDLVASIPKHIETGIEAFTHWKAEAEATTKAIGEMNKELSSVNKQIEDAQRRAASADLAPLGKAQVDRDYAVIDVLRQQAIVDNLQTKLSEMRKATIMVGGGIGPMGEDFPGTPIPKFSDAQMAPLNAQYIEAAKTLELLKSRAEEAGGAVQKVLGKDREEEAKRWANAVTEADRALEKVSGQIDAFDKLGSIGAYQSKDPLAEIAHREQEALKEVAKILEQYPELTAQAEEARTRIHATAVHEREDAERQSFIKMREGFADQISHDLDRQREETNKAIEQQKHLAEEWIHERDKMANSIATLFEDITAGNIGSHFKKMFEQLIAEMVANWAMGVRAMSSVASGGFGGSGAGGGGGGILSGLFGLSGRSQAIGFPNSLAGGSGGFGGIGTPSFADVGTSDISLGLGGSLSSGLPTFGSGGLPAGASVNGTGVSASAPQGLSALFANGGLKTLLAAGGSLAGLSLIGSQNPALRGIGGAGLGFGIGSLVGGLSTSLVEAGVIGPGLAALLGTAGGPIGAAIGGVIALLSALGPKHQGDRHTFEMAELDAIGKVMSAYQNKTADYNSAVSTLEQLRKTGDDQFATWGVSNHASDQVDSHINIAEGQLSSMEAVRQAQASAILAEQQRRGALSFGPALFGNGGVVGDYSGTVPPWFAASARYYASGGDVIPAMLTPGEGVVTRDGMQRIGTGGLKAINSGGNSSSADMHIHIHAFDGASVESWLSRGGDKQIAAAIIKLRSQGIRVA